MIIVDNISLNSSQRQGNNTKKGRLYVKTSKKRQKTTKVRDFANARRVSTKIVFNQDSMV